jgi:DNA-binding XRE family transcriptional regulator/desulfoferrodoxin (superoxide reductase-like protein)
VNKVDCKKIGTIILALRKERQLTQQELAGQLNICDKTVSKWERGLGCPDVSLLSKLSSVLDVDLQSLLSGELDKKGPVAGNMKKLTFYVCPSCGNLISGTSKASISCCGKKLQALTANKAEDADKLRVQRIENEYFIETDHAMTKEHYITFVALLTGDSMMLRKQYPEWNIQTRIPCFGHGMLLWYCTKHGLFYQMI